MVGSGRLRLEFQRLLVALNRFPVLLETVMDRTQIVPGFGVFRVKFLGFLVFLFGQAQALQLMIGDPQFVVHHSVVRINGQHLPIFQDGIFIELPGQHGIGPLGELGSFGEFFRRKFQYFLLGGSQGKLSKKTKSNNQ